MKKKQKPNKQFRYQERCIFCGKTPLTHEEIYAKWIRGYLTSHFTKTAHHTTFQNTIGVHAQQTKLKQGSPYVQTLKVVCKLCNGGWMSKIQNNTKDILTPLILGFAVDLTDAAREQLAIWITMFVIINEYSDKNTIAVTQTERNEFYENKKPLKNWHFFYAPYSSVDKYIACHHRGFGFTHNGNIHEGFNTQITLFSLGKVVICCFSSSNPWFNQTGPRQATGVLSELGFDRIWPLGSYTPLVPMQVLNENIFLTLVNDIHNRWLTHPDNNLYVLSNTY